MREHIEDVFNNDGTHEANEAPAASMLLRNSKCQMLLSIKGTHSSKKQAFCHLLCFKPVGLSRNTKDDILHDHAKSIECRMSNS